MYVCICMYVFPPCFIVCLDLCWLDCRTKNCKVGKTAWSKDAHRRNRTIISKSKIVSIITTVLTMESQRFSIDSLQPKDAVVKHDISDSSTGKLSFP